MSVVCRLEGEKVIVSCLGNRRRGGWILSEIGIMIPTRC